ncbi:MAG: GIDE domain-containing protein [Polyangiaceae bacterium]
MNVLGWLLAFVGFVGLIIGFVQMRKGKKLASVPFRTPSEIAKMGPQAADAKGLVSTEGSVVDGPHLLIAPMSGKPCLSYEITVERSWEKYEQTQNGSEKKTGSDKVFTEKRGAIFPVSDGQGTVTVDLTGSVDSDSDKTHESKVPVGMVIPGMLGFGQLQMNTPVIASTDSRTVAFVGKEKIVAPSATLFALGKLEMDATGPVLRTPKGFGSGSLMLSAKGRGKLVGNTKRNMTLGYSIGGVLAVAGTLLGIFGPKVESNSCPVDLATLTKPSCDGRVSSATGESHTWHLATGGTYKLTVTPSAVKNPLTAALVVKTASGTTVAEDENHAPGKVAEITHTFEPGDYKVEVSDAYGITVKGGYSYALGLEKLPDAPKAPEAPSAAPVAAAAKPGVKPAVAAGAAAGAAAALAAKPAAAPATGAASAAKPGTPAAPAAAAPAAAGAAAAAAKPATTGAALAAKAPGAESSDKAKAAPAPTAAAAKPAAPAAAASAKPATK